MIDSAVAHYETQKEIAERAKVEGLNQWRASVILASAALAQLQREAVMASLEAVEDMLTELGIEALAEGLVRAFMFVGVSSNGGDLVELLRKADSAVSMARIFATQTADAGRVASGVSIAVRPALVGYVRMVNPPCCGRCAILAGRVYKWSSGFQRHPNCDCVMIPTTIANPDANPLLVNPDALFRAGQIKGLSKADQKALREGADLGRVINVRSKKSGLQTAGGRVLARGGRPTPEGIYRMATNRTEAIAFLRRFGYIT